jgi:hypothetical protein
MATTLDFSKFNNKYKNDEEFNAALEADRGPGKYFKPGQYELEVTAAEIQTDDTKNDDGTVTKGPIKFCKDPRWATVIYTFKAVGGEAEIRHFLMVPLAGAEYQGQGGKKPTLLMFHKFKSFVKSLGINADAGNIPEVLREYFSDPAVQVGARLKATLGHEDAHGVVVRKKSEEGGLLMKLVDKNGKDIVKEDGSQVTGPNDQVLKLWCKTQKPEIRFGGFVRILETEPSANPVEIKKFSDAAKGIFD